MKIKTNELIDKALDWAVCKAKGEHQCPYDQYTPAWLSNRRHSTDWAQGGPIIEKEKLSVQIQSSNPPLWTASCPRCVFRASGHTALVAAMRCFVASRLGAEVDVPDELTQEVTQ